MGRRFVRLDHDPIPFLLSSPSSSVVYFARRDLMDEDPGPVHSLWTAREAERILARQEPDGRWRYPGGNLRIRSREDYDQLETFRQLGFCVEKFGLDQTHQGIRKAAGFLFAQQTSEGDFRGIYGRQYSPNYTAGILELLIKAGYGEDNRIDLAFRWLVSIRQRDGGWAIPFRTVAKAGQFRWTDVMRSQPLQPDASRPFSHMVTGVVLRAFAAHKRYRHAAEARAAGLLVAGRFFKTDSYPDRKAAGFWEKVSFPFWFTDIVSALDSLSLLGFTDDDDGISNALDWLAGRQRKDGSFGLKLLRDRDRNLNYWVCLAACRVFKRFDS